MHVLFLAPDTGIYNHRFVRALKAAGARVSAFGHAEPHALATELRGLLDHYDRLQSLFNVEELLGAVRRVTHLHPADRIETIDEPLIVPAARLRATLGLPGLTVEQATLCRDKAAMKERLREHGIPCARSALIAAASDAHRFAEEEGYPIILKPRDGFGTLSTYRAENAAELERALAALKPGDAGKSILAEEFIDGHEGFYDTITAAGGQRHDFIAHYYPTCLEAIQDRAIAPQIAVTNRVEAPGYQELRDVGARVVEALGLERTATHMEWFFGSKGLRVSEIGARPAGERIWDLHARANEFDVYAAWADATLNGRLSGTPSRRLAAGSVQVRPDRDGRFTGHSGLDEVVKACRDRVFEFDLPRPGTPTQGLDRGWLVNTWFRLVDPDYDRLRATMTFISRTVKSYARAD